MMATNATLTKTKLNPNKLEIVYFSPELSGLFKAINEEWISEMFVLEEIDKSVLDHPVEKILTGGGHILFVKAPGLGIVGTGALMQTAPGEFELTKMGVYKSARGLGAGDFLLQALIHKAQEVKAECLYLLTNKRCEAAIHLYEKNGFYHDSEILKKHGGEYERCNVAMRWQPPM